MEKKKKKDNKIVIPFNWECLNVTERLNGQVEVILLNKNTGKVVKEIL